MWLSAIWDNMRFAYNEVADENGWGEWPYARMEGFFLGSHQTIGYTDFECTVVAMIDKTYGKMPESGSGLQVIMEFESYISLFANSTTFNETMVDSETIGHFKDWMRDTPNLAY